MSKDISKIRFCEALPSDTRILGDIKTRKQRKIPCNQRLSTWLNRIERVNSFVFLSPRGYAINSHDVLNRTWRLVVEELVDNGDVREYLPAIAARQVLAVP